MDQMPAGGAQTLDNNTIEIHKGGLDEICGQDNDYKAKRLYKSGN